MLAISELSCAPVTLPLKSEMTYSMSYLLSLLPWGPGRPILTRTTLSNRTVTRLFKINYIVLHVALCIVAMHTSFARIRWRIILLYFETTSPIALNNQGKLQNLFRSTTTLRELPNGNGNLINIMSVPPSSTISSQPSFWLSSLRRLECLPLSLEEILIRDLDKFDFPLVKSQNKIISCVSL